MAKYLIKCEQGKALEGVNPLMYTNALAKRAEFLECDEKGHVIGKATSGQFTRAEIIGMLAEIDPKAAARAMTDDLDVIDLSDPSNAVVGDVAFAPEDEMSAKDIRKVKEGLGMGNEVDIKDKKSLLKFAESEKLSIDPQDFLTKRAEDLLMAIQHAKLAKA